MAVTRKPCSVKRGAELLGVQPVTIRAWISQRRIPYYKLGRRIVLDENELIQYLEKSRVEAVDVVCGLNHKE